jgi:hypothetical protein
LTDLLLFPELNGPKDQLGGCSGSSDRQASCVVVGGFAAVERFRGEGAPRSRRA